jgi:hypothetical protein
MAFPSRYGICVAVSQWDTRYSFECIAKGLVRIEGQAVLLDA